MKDVKRRKLLVEYAADRLRVKAIKKNDILPTEIVVDLYFILLFIERLQRLLQTKSK